MNSEITVKLPKGTISSVFDWLDNELLRRAMEHDDDADVSVSKASSTNSRYYHFGDTKVRVSDHTKKVFNARSGSVDMVLELDMVYEYEEMIDKALSLSCISETDHEWFLAALAELSWRIKNAGESGKKAAQTRAANSNDADAQLQAFILSSDGINFLKKEGFITAGGFGSFRKNRHVNFARTVTKLFPRSRIYEAERFYEHKLAGKKPEELLKTDQ